jgi:protein TonB
MDNQQLKNASYEDIIFEGRNKLYGAYALRVTYEERVRTSLLIILFCIAGLFCIYMIQKSFNPTITTIKKPISDIICILSPPPYILPDLPLDIPPKKLHKVKTINGTPPVIVDKKVIDDKIATVDDLLKATTIASSTIIGDDIPITSPIEPRVAVIEKDKNTDVIQVFVDNSADFPGGNQALAEFVRNRLNYPPQALMYNIQGTVYIQFVVEKNGDLSNITVQKDIGGGCGAEALRVVSSMPKWNAGEQSGNKVRQRITIPIKFQLK